MSLKDVTQPVKKLHDQYYSHTPVIWAKIGDSILLFGTTMTATFAGMEVGKEWIITMSIVTAFGKMITNFFQNGQHMYPQDKQEPTQ